MDMLALSPGIDIAQQIDGGQAGLVHPDHMELLQAYPSGPGSCALHLLDPTREPLGLPASVNRFIQVINRGDAAAMLEFFDKQSGVVVDDGRRFVGHTAIAAWSAVEFLGAKGRLSPESLSQEGTTVTVLGQWKSAAYTGPTRFVFVCDGARFRELHLGQ